MDTRLILDDQGRVLRRHAQAARNGTLEGPTQTFTVADGEVTTFTYDPAATTLTVTTEPPA